VILQYAFCKGGSGEGLCYRRAMRAAPGLLVLGVAGALLAVALFFGRGSSDGRLYWIGIGASVAALVLVFATLLGFLPGPSPTQRGWWALGLFTAFVLWSGLTLAWSIAPDRSWAYLNRGLAYVAFVVLGLFVAALVRRPATWTAGVLAGLCLGVLAWALLGKVFPGLFPDGARVARLRNPIGYWNALALVAALSFPLGLWLAAGRGHARLLRATGVVLLYAAGIALVLTYSRAGIVVAAAGICLWLWLTRDRFEGLAMLVAAGVPAVCVVAWASTQPGIVDHLQTSATRERAGGWFALALVLGVAAALGLSHYAAREGDRLSADARRRWALRLGGALAVVGVGVVIAATVAIGGPGEWLDEFRGKGDVVQGSGRLGELSSNNRWTWWGESWDLFREAPAAGHGAHTFEIARRPIRVGSVVTEEPHNVALQALAETGLAGLLLGLGAAALALLACREALRRLEGDERGAGAALAVLLPIYLLHALADIDWDFVAASAPVLFAVGVLLAAGRPAAEPRSRPVLAVVACLAGLGVLYSMTAPWLSQRRVEAAYEAIAENDLSGAVSAARQARDLNPLSVEPLWAWALADARSPDPSRTLRRYTDATELQPENSDTWFALGAYELGIGRFRDAYLHLDRAYALDPYGPAGVPGGLLDQARAKVEGR
jgi:tetratricopeptide (TPR) repeat protein